MATHWDVSSELELYVEIPSLPPPFDANPQMRALEIAQRVVDELAKRDYRLVRLNFANGDMVGHTGNLSHRARGRSR